MPNEIPDKYSASTAMAITLASLATTTTGVGRQTTLIDNTSSRYQDIMIYYKIKQGTSPTGSKGVYFYLIRKDNHATPHIDDGAGASDASHTVVNAVQVGTGINKASPSTGDVISGSFVIHKPGDYWGLSVNHDTGVNLDSTEENHYIRYEGINPEVQ